MAHGFPEIIQPKDTCIGCLMSKQTRKPFPGQTQSQSKWILELVHGDLCGPITPATKSDNRYFLLLVDDFSKIMWVYMLKTKDEALGALKKFRVLVEKECAENEKLKIFRTDRGGGFLSHDFSSYCEEIGIIRHLTVPYSPQQNGVVERRNRTVVALARSFLKEKQLPSEFWGEAVRHSVYILNSFPTRALSGKTPTGRKSDIGHV